jgi:hypothetical protein
MKHYLHGRTHLVEAPLCPPAPAADAIHIVPLDAASASPNVEVVKQGEKIVRLIVTCSCGEHIEIECLYPTGG